MVQIMNINSENVYFPKNSKLNTVQNHGKKGCYLTNTENVF